MDRHELEQNVVWLYHNDYDTWVTWAINMSDMWTAHWTKSMSQQKWRKFRQSGAKTVPKEALFEAICEELEKDGFNKLLILFKM